MRAVVTVCVCVCVVCKFLKNGMDCHLSWTVHAKKKKAVRYKTYIIVVHEPVDRHTLFVLDLKRDAMVLVSPLQALEGLDDFIRAFNSGIDLPKAQTSTTHIVTKRQAGTRN